jgi:hypothetical protein
MGNNIQNMKVYTEEQVRKAIELSRDTHQEGRAYMEIDVYDYSMDEVFDLLNPIELPSDEEIDRESEVLYPINKGGSMWMPSRYDIDKKNRQEGFLDGAKWMRDKIQGGNNDQR